MFGNLISILIVSFFIENDDRLCDQVVRVSGYRSRGPGFYFRRFQMF
jgi:hypothetical protein